MNNDMNLKRSPYKLEVLQVLAQGQALQTDLIGHVPTRTRIERRRALDTLERAGYIRLTPTNDIRNHWDITPDGRQALNNATN